MKRAAGLAAAACVFVFWAARSAFACDCVALKAPTTAVRTEAPIIFEGQVVEILDRSLHITRTTPSDSTGETRPLGREVVFQVSREWAGGTTRRLSLYVDASDCAFVFEAGHHYVVFARRDTKGRPTTSTCTRTAETDRAQDVLKVLGRSKPPHRLP